MSRVVPIDDTAHVLLSQTSVAGGTTNMETAGQSDQDVVSENHRVCLTELAQRLGTGDLPRPAWEATSSPNGLEGANVSSTTKRRGMSLSPRLCDRIKER